jgi:hypothetical protein
MLDYLLILIITYLLFLLLQLLLFGAKKIINLKIELNTCQQSMVRHQHESDEFSKDPQKQGRYWGAALE